MRICFVAYFNEQKGRGDMGTKNVAWALANEVSKMHEVLKVDIRNIESWNKTKAFRPDIIHFVFAPTAVGFVVAKVFSLYCRSAKVVMSAPNPTLTFKWLIKHLRPDIVLAQAQESEQFFQDLGFITKFLPNGVDIDRFVPVSPEQKEKLREKYRINVKKFVILHVGPIIRKRNIEQLLGLQKEDFQILVIGRRPYDPELLKELKEKGAIVFTEYIEKIEEIYALSDCYIFPTDPENRGACIEMPLSVLEAMACNLPILTTRFMGLSRIFIEDEGFSFINKNNLIDLSGIRSCNVINTRDMVSLYSWEKIANFLDKKIYSSL